MRVFCTTVKALGLQVRSMHGAVPLCAAHEARECETCTHTHTTQRNTTTLSILCLLALQPTTQCLLRSL